MSNEIDSENFEQVARMLGERWARRLWTERSASGRAKEGWPCTLDQARKLIDETLGRKISGDRQEALALIAERSARAAWQQSSREK